MSIEMTSTARYFRLAAFLVGAGITVLAPSAARADISKVEQDRAEALFQAGKNLMAERKFEDACPKFEESQRIDPATGTLLALALCHEGQGRIGSAYREFKLALPAVQIEKRRDRESLVHARMKDLSQRVPKLVIVVDDDAAADTTLAMRLDGEPVARSAWGTEILVDPGDHVLSVTGRGKPWQATVSLPGERSVRRLIVHRLEVEQATAASTPVSAAPAPSQSPTKVVGIALVGAGVVGVGIGSFFGVKAIQKSSDAKALCDPGACTDPSAASVNDDAKSAATVSTLALVIGGAAIVGGGVLWLTSKRAVSVTAAPAFGPGHVGVSALARF